MKTTHTTDCSSSFAARQNHFFAHLVLHDGRRRSPQLVYYTSSDGPPPRQVVAPLRLMSEKTRRASQAQLDALRRHGRLLTLPSQGRWMGGGQAGVAEADHYAAERDRKTCKVAEGAAIRCARFHATQLCHDKSCNKCCSPHSLTPAFSGFAGSLHVVAERDLNVMRARHATVN